VPPIKILGTINWLLDQCLRSVGINEDLSFYEGAGEGPDVAEVKEAIRKEAMTK